jgi:hypothetical protein
MSVKQNFILGIINDEGISEANNVISKYATKAQDTSSHMYFAKQPINTDEISNDVIFFQIVGEDESQLDKKIENLIKDMENLNIDYVLRDGASGEFLVTVKYGGQIAVKFDNVDVVKPGTFEKIDELKFLKNDLGYCKGFKPSFRPLEGKSTENINVLPEIIYIASDCEENLLKLRDHIIRKVLEIDSDLECEFTWFFR